MKTPFKIGDRVKLTEAIPYDDGTTFPKDHEGVITAFEGDLFVVEFPVVGYRGKFNRDPTSDISLMESEIYKPSA
jgi:hypothetical protein